MPQQIRHPYRLRWLDIEQVANRYLEAVGRISEGLYARTTVKDAVQYTLLTGSVFRGSRIAGQSPDIQQSISATASALAI